MPEVECARTVERTTRKHNAFSPVYMGSGIDANIITVHYIVILHLHEVPVCRNVTCLNRLLD